MKKKNKKLSPWNKPRDEDMDKIHKPKHIPEKQKYKHNKFWLEEDELEETFIRKKGHYEEE